MLRSLRLAFVTVLGAVSLFFCARTASASFPCGLCDPTYHQCDTPCLHCYRPNAEDEWWTSEGSCWGYIVEGECRDMWLSCGESRATSFPGFISDLRSKAVRDQDSTACPSNDGVWQQSRPEIIFMPPAPTHPVVPAPPR